MLLRIHRLACFNCFKYSLKRRQNVSQLPTSVDSLIGDLQQQQTLQGTLDFIVQRMDEFSVAKRRTFQIIHQSLTTKPNYNDKRKLINTVILSKVIKQFIEWCDNPQDQIELYILLIELRQQKNLKFSSTQTLNINQHIVELRKIIKQHIESPSCTDINLISRYICAIGSDSTYDNDIFQKLKSLQAPIDQPLIILLLNAFVKLGTFQKRYVYNFTYRLCSQLKIETMSDLQRSYVYRHLCELDLVRNSSYKRPVRVIQEIIDMMGDTKLLNEGVLINYILGSSFRREEQQPLLIELDTQKIKSVQLYQQALNAPNIELRISQSNRQKIKELVWNRFATPSNKGQEQMKNLYDCLSIFGQKAALIYITRISALKTISYESIKNVMELGKYTNLKQLFSVAFEKILIYKINNPNETNSTINIIGLYELYHKHIKKFPQQKLSVELENRVEQAIDNALIHLESKIFKKGAKGIIGRFFEQFAGTDVPFIKKIEQRLHKLFHSMQFKKFDQLDIILRVKNISQQNISNFLDIMPSLEDPKQIGYLKTIYASMKNHTPEVFVLIWNRIGRHLSPSNKLFLILCTERAVVASKYVEDNVFREVAISSKVDFSKEFISVRSITLLYDYTNSIIIDHNQILDCVEYNIDECMYLKQRSIESNIQLLVFYLSKIHRQGRSLPEPVIQPITGALRQILNKESINSIKKQWFYKSLMQLVLSIHLHHQLNSFTKNDLVHELIEIIMKETSQNQMLNTQLKRSNIKQILTLFELAELNYKLEYHDRLLEKISCWNNDPVTYRCRIRDNHPRLSNKLNGIAIKLL